MANLTIRTAIEGQQQVLNQLKQIEREIDGVGKRAGAVQQRLQGFGRQLGQIGRSLSLRVSAPIVGLQALILKTAGDFEQAMNQVQAVSGATGREFEALRKQAKELGATTQFSASQAAGAMGFLAQAGFRASQILKALPSTLQLAASANLDLATAADITSNILAGYRFEVEDLARVNDVLVKAFTSANTNLQQLGEALKFAGPVASAAGLTFEEAAAALGILGNAGIQATLAGTSLRGAIAKLLDPTPKAAKLMKELGLSFKDANDRLIPFDEIIQQLEPHVNNASIFLELFGLRAGPAMAQLVSAGSDALRQLIEQLINAGGVSKRIAEVQLKGFNGAMRQLRSATEGLAIAIGESGVLQGFTNFTLALTKSVQQLNKTDPALLKLSFTIAALVAAIAPALIVLGAVTAAIAALATPIGASVLAVTGLIAAFFLFSGRVRAELSSFFADLRRWFVDTFGELVDYVGERLKDVTGFFQDMYDAVVGASIVPEMVDEVDAQFRFMGVSMEEKTKEATGEVTSLFEDMKNTVLTQVTTIATSVPNILESIPGRISGFLEGLGINIIRPGDPGYEAAQTAVRERDPLAGLANTYDNLLRVGRSFEAEAAFQFESIRDLMDKTTEEAAEAITINIGGGARKVTKQLQELSAEAKFQLESIQDLSDSVKFVSPLTEEQTERLKEQLADIRERLSITTDETITWRSATGEAITVLTEDYTRLKNIATAQMKVINEAYYNELIDQEAFQELRRQIDETFIIRMRQAAENVENSLAQIRARLADTEIQTFSVAQAMHSAFQSFFFNTFKDASSFGDNLKTLFQDLVDAILSELARLAASAIFKFALSFIGGGPLGGGGSILSGIPFLGSIFGGGFQTGGSRLVTRPTIFTAGETGPEQVEVTPLGGRGISRIGDPLRAPRIGPDFGEPFLGGDRGGRLTRLVAGVGRFLLDEETSAAITSRRAAIRAMQEQAKFAQFLGSSPREAGISNEELLARRGLGITSRSAIERQRIALAQPFRGQYLSNPTGVLGRLLGADTTAPSPGRESGIIRSLFGGVTPGQTGLQLGVQNLLGTLVTLATFAGKDPSTFSTELGSLLTGLIQQKPGSSDALIGSLLGPALSAIGRALGSTGAPPGSGLLFTGTPFGYDTTRPSLQTASQVRGLAALMARSGLTPATLSAKIISVIRGFSIDDFLGLTDRPRGRAGYSPTSNLGYGEFGGGPSGGRFRLQTGGRRIVSRPSLGLFAETGAELVTARPLGSGGSGERPVQIILQNPTFLTNDDLTINRTLRQIARSVAAEQKRSTF